MARCSNNSRPLCIAVICDGKSRSCGNGIARLLAINLRDAHTGETAGHPTVKFKQYNISGKTYNLRSGYMVVVAPLGFGGYYRGACRSRLAGSGLLVSRA